jgi:tetratricopeptide (TPR) repeat protein
VNRHAAALLLLLPAACGGRTGFQRPDYAAEARARCDEADATSDPNRALALYGMALEAEPKYPRAFLGRARVLERTGRPEQAERSYLMAVEVATDDVRARYLLERARYLRGKGRIEPAVRDLDRAIGLLGAFPDRETAVEARLLRAESRVSLRAWEGAREDLDAADREGLEGGPRERARQLRIRVDTALEERK